MLHGGLQNGDSAKMSTMTVIPATNYVRLWEVKTAGGENGQVLVQLSVPLSVLVGCVALFSVCVGSMFGLAWALIYT